MAVGQEGIVIQTNKGKIFCGYGKLSYKNPPTPLDMLLSGKKVKKRGILFFMYEVISGVSREKCPVIVQKKPFVLDDVLEKYKDIEEQFSGVDLNEVISKIPDFNG